MKKKIGYIALASLLIIQVFSIDKTNPPIDPALDFLQVADVPDMVKMGVKNACLDCHGNTTKYPWYTNIEPVSWWIKGHIDHARGSLNFSEWNAYSPDDKKHAARECVEVLEEGWMPPSSYKLMHKEAKLDQATVTAMIDYFKGL